MIYVGTSGWQYDSWRGPFYPPELPKPRWLAYFSRRFPSVEVNNSFYRLPSADSFARWRAESPSEFVVTIKANRFITHIKRLKDPADAVALFWSRTHPLGDKRGPVLFQLPPRFRADTARLTALLDVLPADMRAAFEFRDPSWEREDVFRLLDERGAALVIPDRPGARPPLVVTGGWTYLRFHQGARTAPFYPTAKLRRWADRIAQLRATDAYVYFNNDPLCAAVRDALTMTALLAERGLPVARPGQAASSAGA